MTDITALTGAGATYAAADTSAITGSSDLGQNDFLTLMTTQLMNQDPFAPMQNGEFLAQMAQFSTVSALEQVNSSLDAIGGQVGSYKITAASAMLGREVLVPGTLARPDAAGEIHGAADLPEAAGSVSVVYSDAESGKELYRQPMGAQPAGRMDFAWADVPEDIVAAHGGLRIAVETDSAQPAQPYVYAQVIGVQTAQGSQDLTLDVEDYGLQSSLEITAVR